MLRERKLQRYMIAFIYELGNLELDELLMRRGESDHLVSKISCLGTDWKFLFHFKELGGYAEFLNS